MFGFKGGEEEVYIPVEADDLGEIPALMAAGSMHCDKKWIIKMNNSGFTGCDWFFGTQELPKEIRQDNQKLKAEVRKRAEDTPGDFKQFRNNHKIFDSGCVRRA